MSSLSVSKAVLYVLNTVFLILGLAIASASIWFFCEVHDFTKLRNSNHYLLDYTVYWPQAIPWVFFIVALLIIGVSVCGFTSARKKSKGLLTMYVTAMSIVIVLLIAAAVIALVFADNKSTDDFVKDTVWDVYFQAKNDNEVATAFGVIERKLHCCGADSPRDYKNWKAEFPMSCCDVFYRGWLDPYAIDCAFTNKLANERHGCSTVAAQYARIAIKVLSGAAIFTAMIGIIAVVFAVAMYKSLKIRNRPPPTHESESKKVLL
ncbi:23 kDa integral membrane protein-like [Maniola jurtina]|uniref:23 kDa integral membrane protein-like n=1 Tax=Maniola jurtina TaxID=191418 RepID=UPI001E68F8D1|nr:23 kDa integral membrane protein-like [Maniola jurtina]